MSERVRAQVLVIGSGAGGAVTALELAARGFDVTVIEEGPRTSLAAYGQPPPAALRELYRDRGMTPLLGPVPIGFVEGCCVGGSTEINSGFWHRTRRETLARWKAAFDLDGASPAEMEPHFEWAETQLGVSLYGGEWPPSTQVFARGIEAMGWSAHEVSRAAPGCAGTNACAHGCPTGAKQGMSVSLLPQAEAHGARILPECRALLLLRRRGRIAGVLASRKRPDGRRELVRLDAEAVFVCGGATQSPALLRRSGIKLHVGNTLNVHPMLKATALFDQPLDSQRSVLPLLQVKEFWPEISIGGAFFTPGHLAMALSENWPENHELMRQVRHMASYYVAVTGTGYGMVRPARFGGAGTVLRYRLTRWERRNLSLGLARMAMLLLAAGARAVYPAGQGLPPIRTETEAARWLDELLPPSALSLTTVHAFSSCPAGERPERCAVDSYGAVFGYQNLRVNDASILPDSTGVNPQGSIMAMARRNVLHFAEMAGR